MEKLRHKTTDEKEKSPAPIQTEVGGMELPMVSAGAGKHSTGLGQAVGNGSATEERGGKGQNK